MALCLVCFLSLSLCHNLLLPLFSLSPLTGPLSNVLLLPLLLLQEDAITFTVVQPPRHGTIERTNNGQHYRQTSTFTMDDIYQNRISYNHDGSNSLKDRFTFTVADGTNMFFLVEEGGKEVCVCAHFVCSCLF